MPRQDPPAREYRNYTLSLRLKPDEHRALDHAADGRSYSDYVRACLFGDLKSRRRKAKKPPAIEHQDLSRILAWIGASRVANNLNQIARAVNCGEPVYDSREDQISQACADIRELKQAVLKALGCVR